MQRVIITKCGQRLYGDMMLLDLLSRQRMHDALIGCGTDDNNGAYVEIADVYFILPVLA